MVQRVIFGQPSDSVIGIPDASLKELTVLAPLAFLSLLMGVWWFWTLQHFDAYSRELVRVLGG